MSIKPPITAHEYKHFQEAISDGYMWEVHYANSCNSPFVRFYATNLQAALWLINTLVRTHNLTGTALAELYRTNPYKYPSSGIDYVQDLSCFCSEMTDATFLHMYKDGEVYEL